MLIKIEKKLKIEINIKVKLLTAKQPHAFLAKILLAKRSKIILKK